MAALTTIATVVGAAVAVGGYVQNSKAAKAQKRAGEEAKIAAAADAAANRQAADAAVRREQVASAVKQNEQLAAEQMAVTPDVTVAAPESPQNRLRRVQAQFNVDAGGASQNAGSIRV